MRRLAGGEEPPTGTDLRTQTTRTNEGTNQAAPCDVVGSEPLPSRAGWIADLCSQKGWEVDRDFAPRESDVLISTFPKTGTTLVQMICQQIRSKGAGIDFESIDIEATFLSWLWDFGMKPEDDQRYSPRVFKEGGGKFIVCIRDPAKSMVSLLDFFLAKFPGLAGDASRSGTLGFLQKTYGKPMSHEMYPKTLWGYIDEFWRCRDCPNVLVLCFEDLVNPELFETNVRVIAKFMGCDVDSALVLKIRPLCSREFMIKHSELFDDSGSNRRLAEVGRSTHQQPLASKVTDGSHHGKKLLVTGRCRRALRKAWARSPLGRGGLGFGGYEDLIAAYRAHQRESEKFQVPGAMYGGVPKGLGPWGRRGAAVAGAVVDPVVGAGLSAVAGARWCVGAPVRAARGVARRLRHRPAAPSPPQEGDSAK